MNRSHAIAVCLCVLGLALAAVVSAQAPSLLVEYRAANPMSGSSIIRVMSDGAYERVEQNRGRPNSTVRGRITPAELARVRAAVQAARIAPQPTRHRGPIPPDPTSESMTLPRRAHVAWISGDTPAPATMALRNLLNQLHPQPSTPVISGPPANSGPASSGPPAGPADS